MFVRIVLRLWLPLLFLGMLLSGIQLAQQIATLNEILGIEAVLIMQNVSKTFRSLTPEEAVLPDILRKKTESLTLSYPALTLEIYDPLADKVLLGRDVNWSETDKNAAQISLRNLRQEKTYAVRTDKTHRALIGYIPFESGVESEFYVARAALPLARIGDALRQSQGTLLLIIMAVLAIGILMAWSLARLVVHPVRILEKASREIMEGRLKQHVTVKTGDELERLAQTFNRMSDRLQQMQQRAVDSNPLTHLPGNQGIFQELSKRLLERQKFVLFHVDIDRFKLFNDHMGLARGDEVIRKTTDILKRAVREKGSADDFVGHQGGDDFVLMTRPQKAAELADFVCQLFEKEVKRSVYREEDLQKGFTMQVDRRSMDAGSGLRKFPLIAISLGGISTAKKDFVDYFSCMSAVIKAKEEAKKIPESSYVIHE